MNIFTTREIVVAIYLIIILIYALIHKNIRTIFLDVIRIAFTPKLLIPFILILVYTGILTYLFTRIPIWNWIYVKDILLWTIFIGIPLCFNVASRGIEKHTFRDILIDNIRLTAILEFFLGTFTFSLCFEFFLQPALVLLIAADMKLSKNSKSHFTKKVIDFIFAVGGLTLLYLTITNAINVFKASEASTEFIDIIISFCLPILLSSLFIPVIYLMAVYARYDKLFVLIDSKEPNDKKSKIVDYFKILLLCRISLNRICEFHKEYVNQVYINAKNIELSEIIKEYREKKKKQNTKRNS